jgi:hypothetical protein
MSLSDLTKLWTTSSTSQNSDFQSFFSVENWSNLSKKKFYGLGNQALKIFFWKFGLSKYINHFLEMCPIFVGSTHNFGRSDTDIIWWKNAYVVSCSTRSKNLESTLMLLLPPLMECFPKCNFILHHLSCQEARCIFLLKCIVWLQFPSDF